tara:strand:- start:135 stop:371 length:237 start_codon:yes stop_codon:yes gene_type:complete
MKLTKETLRQIIKEEVNDLNSTITSNKILDNLRSSAIVELVKVMEEIDEQSDVMGANAVDITGAIRDCIQRIQGDPTV